MFKKRKQLIGWLGLGLFIGGLGCSTNAFAMERHSAYLERNYADKQGVMHHLTKQECLIAQEEFSNTIDPYKDYKILDAFKSKNEVISGLDAAFKNSKKDDINYLVIHSHGWEGGIIDFSFKELKGILDQYKGHFVIAISACNSGGAINKIQKSLMQTFLVPQNKIGEFKDSKYNVFCSSSKTQNSYMTSDYGFFIKAYFDSSRMGKNGFLNADTDQNNIVTASELSEYLKVHGAAGNATPVSQVVDPELPVFATNRSTFDFNGIGTWAGKDTHFAQLKYNGDHTATLKEGVEMYGCHVHPYFEGIYASILAKDKDGNTLFTKEFKGTDDVQAKEENFSLPEGATLTLYHAEGTSGRYETSNDKKLKQNAIGNTYYYIVKNGILSQQVNKQEFNFLGLGDYKFAQLDIVNGVAKLDSKYTSHGSHCYFKDNVYASVVVNDQTGKEIFKKEYKGDKNTPAGLNNIELKEGYTLTIHHEEPSRLKTNNDTNLHKESSKDFHYTFTKVNDDGLVSLVATEKAAARDNIYRISSVLDQTKCLDNNPAFTDLFVWSKQQEADNHYFSFHFVSNDIVKISSKDKSRWLTTNGENGSTITQTTNEQVASYWQIKNIDNNKVVLHYMGNKETELSDSNLSLNICGGKANEGAKLILYSSSYDYAANQQFILD